MGVRMRVTIVCEYDARMDDYDTAVPQEMAAVDEDNMLSDRGSLVDVVTHELKSVTVTAVES